MTWSALGVCVAGTSHRTLEVPCQDAFQFRVFGPGGEWLAVVVADGAGSASHSHIAAPAACDGVVRRVVGADPSELLTRDSVTRLLAGVRDELLAEAVRLGVASRQLACTLLLAVIGPASATFAQIGDGAIVRGDGHGLRAAFWPEPAEYANATDFLTDDRFADALLFEATTDPIAEVAVITDGLQRLALDFTARLPHPEFFRPLFHTVRAAADPESLGEPLRAFLDSPRVNERTDDDKTLVVAARQP